MRVLIAYPSKWTTDALAHLLISSGDVEIVGPCQRGEQAIEQSARVQPDVIITATGFSDAKGQSYFERLKSACATAAILAISSEPTADEFGWVMSAGAAGYAGADCDGKQLLEAVSKVYQGEVIVTGIDRRALSSEHEDGIDPGRKAALSNLTPREKEVLSLLSRGFSNREIAESLFVSEHTVRTHVQNLRSKLNVRSKFQAAMLAMQAAPQGEVSGGIRL